MQAATQGSRRSSSATDERRDTAKVMDARQPASGDVSIIALACDSDGPATRRGCVGCRPNSREGVGEPNAMHIECARWDKLIKEGMVPKEFLEDYRRAKYGYAGLITLEKSDLQLYEGGRVSAVNKSGAVNPQLMKPKFH
ncbi:hypothetical protein Scep_029478 [Stephania cephalantha]|uniref:Uncharacterized protein n=1 Tax=Stephania cephalantha TaxID=152367 RepID=A0AAP0HFM6_9MAGN